MPIFISTGAPDTALWQQVLTALTPVISVVGALLVVQRTNKGNATSQKDRLDHESREAEKVRLHADKQAENSRLHEVRKDLAKEAAKTLVVLNAYLGTLATSPRTIDGTPFKEFTIAASQLQLVVEPATSAKIEKLVAEYTKMHLALLAKVVPVLRIQNDIDVWVEHTKKPSYASSLAPAELAKLRPQLLQHQLALMEWLINENKRLSSFRFDALSAVRKDMFADGDLSEVRKVFEDEWDHLKPLFDELIKTVRENG